MYFLIHGVTLVLKDNGSRYNMYCTNDDGMKGITKYNKGDKITVIGVMDTMVSNNLRLDNCIIMD